MKNDLDLLVVGMRKSGTSWLYENCLKEKTVGINKMVKETGFFSKKNISIIDIEKYNKNISSGIIKAEFDASICYSDIYVKNVENHTKNDISLRLIVRNPIDYLVSRFIHSKRKGEIKSDNLFEVIEENKWLRDELNYQLIIERFMSIERRNKRVIPFELLNINPKLFKNEIFSDFRSFNDFSNERINQARISKYPLLSEFLAKSAKFARKNGFHSLVNIAKSSGINELLENKSDEIEKNEIKKEAEKVILSEFNSSIKCWEKINERCS